MNLIARLQIFILKCFRARVPKYETYSDYDNGTLIYSYKMKDIGQVLCTVYVYELGGAPGKLYPKNVQNAI